MPDAGYRMLILIARNEDAFDPLITGLPRCRHHRRHRHRELAASGP